jgi:hypothetical protein
MRHRTCIAALSCVLVAGSLTPPVAAQAPATLPADIVAAIKKDYVMEGTETRYIDAWVDLSGDGKPEAIIHVVGPMACGTGGCPTMIFTPTATGYRLVSTMSVSRPPIRVSATKTRGWRNVIVHVAGGGAKGHDAELLFNGTRYPGNPSVAGPNVKAAAAGGDVVIADFASFADAKKLPGGAPTSRR